MLPTPPRLPCADELDEYIDDHAAEFVVYEPGGEQQLGWHDVHLQYVALVEGKIHEFLGQLGAATAVVQVTLLGRMLMRGVWPGLAGQGPIAPGSLHPLTHATTLDACCVVGFAGAAPGLASAVRLSTRR